ncbi:hypothetical protein L195_g064490, partial [Trifolium pratense]
MLLSFLHSYNYEITKHTEHGSQSRAIPVERRGAELCRDGMGWSDTAKLLG